MLFSLRKKFPGRIFRLAHLLPLMSSMHKVIILFYRNFQQYSVSRAKIFIILAAATLLLSAGCSTQNSVRELSSSSSRSTSGTLFVKMQSDIYLIKPGDKIEFSVWDYPEFNTSTMVTTNGTIALPLVGDIRAAGLTKEDFSELAKRKLIDYVKEEPQLTISISSPTAQKINVIGAVSRQDTYLVTSEVSLQEILSTAGGSTPESDLTHVRIIRAGSDNDPIEVDVANAMETGRVESMPKVRPGDTVYVPKKENFVRLFSDFMRDAVLLLGFFRVLY
jgi:polysaccharide export outer membrane protein